MYDYFNIQFYIRKVNSHNILFEKVSVRTPTRLFAFLTPLAIEIWIYMAGAYILVSITMWIAARFSSKEWKELEPCDECLHDGYVNLQGTNCDHLSDETEEHNFKDDINIGQIKFPYDLNTGHANAEICHEEKSIGVLENGFSIGNSFWFAIGSLMQQGSDLNPKVHFCFRRY